jgi:Protein tyrosine and serine/threonine kinase
VQVFRGETYGAKADIFSVSMVIYQLFTQRNISSQFEVEADAYDFGLRACCGARPSLSAKIPAAVCDILKAAWSQDPARRPEASELLAQLQALADSDQHVNTKAKRPNWLARACCMAPVR